MSSYGRFVWVPLLLAATASAAFAASPEAGEPTLKSLEGRKIEVRRQSLTQGLTDKSIEGYEAFLKTPLGGAMRREALRRLADQIIERLEDLETQRVEEAAKALAPATPATASAPTEPPKPPEKAVAAPPVKEQAKAKGKKAPKGAPAPAYKPLPTVPDEDSFLRNATYADAIRLYREALDKYSSMPGNEHILYQLARAYEANGEPEKALQSLDTIAEKHPFSVYAEEVLFRRAELGFLLQKYDIAEKAYRQILDKGEKTDYFAISQYKYAWSLFKQQQYEKSLDAFFTLLDKSISGMRLEDFLAGMPTMNPGEKELVKDTLRVISLAFSHMDGPESLYKYFARVGEKRDYEFLVYETLADLYFTQERNQDAADTYKAFIKNNPTHPQAPFFHLMAMEAYRKGQFVSKILEGKKEFAKAYGFQTRFWDGQPDSLRAQVEPYLRMHITELAQYYHAEAQSNKRAENYIEAVDWYQAFLQSFPKDPDAASIQFLLGELLFETKRYAEAADAYEKAAYNYGEHEKATEAGYAALLAYDEHGKSLANDPRKDWDRKGVASALRFAKANRKDNRVPAILTKAARTQFELNDLAEAAKTAEDVVNYKPTPAPDLLRASWLIIAHAQFEAKDFRLAESSYKSAIKLMKADDLTRAGTVERLAASIYKQGEAMRDENKFDGAVRHFLRIAQEAPESPIRHTADYDASALLIQLKEWSQAIKVLERLRGSPIGQELDGQITQKLVVAYQEAGEDRKAARELERLLKYESNYDIKREAQLQAARLYEKVKDIDGAIHAYVEYTRQFLYPLDARIEAQFKLAQLYRNQGGLTQYQHWLEQVVETQKTAGEQGTDRTRFLASKASFELAAPVMEQYRAVKLVEPVKENLKKKKDLMQHTVKAYTNAADYGIAEITTASTYMIAEIYSDFGKALLNSERPKELNKDELEMYNVMLEEQAYPFEEKAIGLYETNAKRTAQNIYTEWVQKSLAALSKLVPGRYQKPEKSEVYVDALN